MKYTIGMHITFRKEESYSTMQDFILKLESELKDEFEIYSYAFYSREINLGFIKEIPSQLKVNSELQLIRWGKMMKEKILNILKTDGAMKSTHGITIRQMD
ncbi:hypothetical protein ES702_04853 [subsurface metagenome]